MEVSLQNFRPDLNSDDLKVLKEFKSILLFIFCTNIYYFVIFFYFHIKKKTINPSLNKLKEI